MTSLLNKLSISLTIHLVKPLCSVSKLSTEFVGSRRELVANNVLTPPTRHNSTVVSRRRCVLGFMQVMQRRPIVVKSRIFRFRLSPYMDGKDVCVTSGNTVRNLVYRPRQNDVSDDDTATLTLIAIRSWESGRFLSQTTTSLRTRYTQLTAQAEASISTRILGPDPTTSEAYMVHPIVDPTKFWDGVGE